MANHELVFRKSVAKGLKSIPNKDVSRILRRIEALRMDTRADGCMKLSGQARYRVRQGIYRIIYEIQDGRLIIVVVKVANRSGVHKAIV